MLVFLGLGGAAAAQQHRTGRLHAQMLKSSCVRIECLFCQYPTRFPILDICGECQNEQCYPMFVILVLAKHWLPLFWPASDQ